MDQDSQHGAYTVPNHYPTDQYGYPIPNAPYPDKNAIPMYGYPVQGHHPQAAPLLNDNNNGVILRPTRGSSNRILGWKWEILMLLLACGALIAMIAILVRFDGKRVPEWPLAINLTTLVALISTLFRAALLAVMAEIISQAKWLWFGKSRHLIDLQRFDEASRSFVGALKFFGTVPKTVIGTLGATVVILSAAIGPFSQQAIKTVVCQQPNPIANASIPVAQFATGGYFRYGSGLWKLNPDVQGALVNAVANPMGRDSGLSATCTTGNCTFPEHNGITHSSMGFCSACTDITRYLTANETKPYTNYTLPNGPYIHTGSQSPAINIQQNYLSWLPTSALGSSSPYFSASLANITFTTFTRSACALSPDVPACQNNLNVSGLGTQMRPLAVSCAIYPCLKHYHGAVSDGELTETLISTVPASPQSEGTYSINGQHNHTILKTPCIINNDIYSPSNFSLLSPTAHSFEHVISPDGTNISAPFECIYKFHWVYGMAVSDYLQDFLFHGRCIESMSTPGMLNCPDGAFWFNQFWSGGWSNLTWIEGIMANFTGAATNKLRLDGSSLYQGGARLAVQGAAYDTTVCVELDWAWLLLPAGLLGVGIFLLVGIIVSGWFDGGQPVWKSSVLPILFCGLVEQPRFDTAPGEKELVERAKGMTVFLRKEGAVGFTAAH